MTNHAKRRKLPRGPYWDTRSPYIFFKWRDAMGRQRRQSTKTDDPDKALLNKLQFLDQAREKPEEIEAHTEDLGKLALNKAAELYSGNEWAPKRAPICSQIKNPVPRWSRSQRRIGATPFLL
jgi:hypothetical protein